MPEAFGAPPTDPRGMLLAQIRYTVDARRSGPADQELSGLIAFIGDGMKDKRWLADLEAALKCDDDNERFWLIVGAARGVYERCHLWVRKGRIALAPEEAAEGGF